MSTLTNYERANELLTQISEQARAQQLTGTALDRALRIADMYVRMAQVDATREQTELVKAMRRHPAGRKREPEPKPALSPVHHLAVLRPHGGH